MWFLWFVGAIFLIKAIGKLRAGRCYEKTVMRGKVVVVTGASGGIGFETALELARRGAKVIVACRNDARGERAVRTISRLTRNERVRYVHLDLSSLRSVRKFVEELEATEAKLDVLINNAGALCASRRRTDDGLMNDMQINHFGPFLLTTLLVPLLKKAAPSRVVLVSSAWHRFGTIENLNDESTGYIRAYANSKLCNVLFSKELARRLRGTGVVVNSLNPGQVNTSLYRSSTLLEKLRTLVLYFFFKTPAEGAQTSVYLAISNDCDVATGMYFEDCKQVAPSAKAENGMLATKLWAISEQLVGLKPEEVIEEPKRISVSEN
ncbi:unnamed protein product [Leptosia nina]|uniref:Retinol dehydrogenase 11 n=1 Tax=Leptosia nina TaxID=320188 RepID=A0AAV1J0E7_9NEOP